MKILSYIILICLSSALYSQENLQKHHFGLGINTYFFRGDLREQMNTGIGVASEYEYNIFPKKFFDLNVGSRFDIHYSKKNDFQNFNILISPEVSSIFYRSIFDFGPTLAFDIAYLRQIKKYITLNTTLEDLTFGAAFGFFFKWNLKKMNSIKAEIIYHMQEYNSKTTYFSIGAMYVWSK